MWLHGLRTRHISVSFPNSDSFRWHSWVGKECPLVRITENIQYSIYSCFDSSTIIEDIQDMCQTGLASLAIFYFDFRDATKQDARSLLSSLLVQLSHQSHEFSKILSSLHSTHSNGSRQPSVHALMECLKKMLQLPGRGALYLVVDALDECSNSSGYPAPREQVLEIVRELVELCLPDAHFCITSRPEVDIRDVLEPGVSS